MELIEVLNSQGEKTGQVLDKNEVHKLGLYHKEVAIFLINNKKEILLQKRAKTKDAEPNKWAWTGGHVSAYETDEDAIIRETQEELGVTFTKDEIIPLVSIKRDKLPNRQFTSAFYTFSNKSVEDFKIQTSELSKVKWFGFDEFVDLIYADSPEMIFKNNENSQKIIGALEKIIKG